VVYDPAWNMPSINWQQQGSFEAGIIPLVDNPDDGPLVCLPMVNQHWLALLLGCLDQLRNPSTWLVADDAAMSAILAKVDRFKQMMGDRSECLCTLVRLESCQLQTSCDNGATWTTVTGWDPGFAVCVQEQIPVIGLPPNPGDETHDQLACSIAAYLADEVIKASMQQAIANIGTDLNLLTFGASILTIIPEFILVGIAYDAFGIIYAAISEGTISDYEDAISSTSLWLAVRCAIYDAIVGAGLVNSTNFPIIISNLSGISYVHADVISTIVAYVNELGPIGLAQLSQRAGLNTGADCSDCGTWCYQWGGGATDFCNGDWVTCPGGFGTCFDGVWHGQDGGGFYDCCVAYTPPVPILCSAIHFVATTPEYRNLRAYDAPGGTLLVNVFDDHWDGAPLTIGYITMDIEQHTLPCTISQVALGGNGPNPIGDDNCLP